MIDQEQEVLLGRLVVHYKILSKERASEAMKLWRSTSAATGLDFGSFLVAESYIPADTLPKLLNAREKYLRKQQEKTEPEPPPAPAPVPVEPVVAVGAATVTMASVDPAAIEAGAVEVEPVIEVQPFFEGVGAEPVGANTVHLSPEDIAAAAAIRVVEEEPLFEEADAYEVEPVADDQPYYEEAAYEVEPVEGEPLFEEAPAYDMGAVADAEPYSAEEMEDPGAYEETYSVDASPPVGEGLLGYAPGVDLVELLKRAAAMGASDLHVHSGSPLKVRLSGELTDASEAVDADQARELIFGILTPEQTTRLEDHLQLDFSYALPGVGRFRANAYHQQHGLDGVFRIISPTPPTLEDLGMPESLGRFASFHQGMVLFTGPAGCGKSSTMAAFVRMINADRQDHILTIEEPVEYVFTPEKCVVNQREVGPHTESFARALRAALREDPDIIVIGEMRDLETIELALTAAETGHLVLGTLHTASTVPTINRLVGVFPPDAQPQIRTMVSESLRAIISQRLVPRADGEGRVPALEVLVNNKAIGNLIRENRTFQINSILQTGAREGMCRLDASLEQLVKNRTITREAARLQALDPKKFV